MKVEENLRESLKFFDLVDFLIFYRNTEQFFISGEFLRDGKKRSIEYSTRRNRDESQTTLLKKSGLRTSGKKSAMTNAEYPSYSSCIYN